MPKNITFEHEGKEYTLCYTRKSIETLERRGFVIGDIADKPMTLLPEMFAGAFIANHTGTKRKVIDTIFSCLSNKQGLLDKLSEMYHEPLEALFDSDETTKEVNWEADF